MRSIVAGGAGFLLAVLWFDLMFDVQVLKHGQGTIPVDVLASVAAYYRRVTTDARPMNRLVAVAMVVTIAAIIGELVGQVGPTWAAWSSLVLAVAPIALAGTRTVPRAVRLASGVDGEAGRSALARSICRDHLFCLGAISSLLVVQAVGAV